MLKSFEIIESEQLHWNVIDDATFSREQQILVDYIKNTDLVFIHDHCPICGSTSLQHFADFLTVPYLRCQKCYSIVSALSSDTALAFQSAQPLNEFFNSEHYQDTAEKLRGQSWDELIFWVKFRLARYQGSAHVRCAIDYGNRFKGLARRIQKDSFCENYLPAASISELEHIRQKADLILYFDRFAREPDPNAMLRCFSDLLADHGLLIVTTRLGSGFDILTLKEKNKSILPFEYINLPSLAGLEVCLGNAGMEILEVLTPGTLDVKYVLDNRTQLDSCDYFTDFLVNHTDSETLTGFQEFLQKNGLSSYTRIVARKSRTDSWPEKARSSF